MKKLIFLLLLVLSFQSFAGTNPHDIDPLAKFKKEYFFKYFVDNWGLTGTKNRWGNGMGYSSKSDAQLAAFAGSGDSILMQISRVLQRPVFRYNVADTFNTIAYLTDIPSIPAGADLWKDSSGYFVPNTGYGGRNIKTSGIGVFGGLTISGNAQTGTLAVLGLATASGITVSGNIQTGSLSVTNGVSAQGLSITTNAINQFSMVGRGVNAFYRQYRTDYTNQNYIGWGTNNLSTVPLWQAGLSSNSGTFSIVHTGSLAANLPFQIDSTDDKIHLGAATVENNGTINTTASVNAGSETTTGLDNYATNIGSSFSARSKVDKGYVDSIKGTIASPFQELTTGNISTVNPSSSVNLGTFSATNFGSGYSSLGMSMLGNIGSLSPSGGVTGERMEINMNRYTPVAGGLTAPILTGGSSQIRMFPGRISMYAVPSQTGGTTAGIGELLRIDSTTGVSIIQAGTNFNAGNINASSVTVTGTVSAVTLSATQSVRANTLSITGNAVIVGVLSVTGGEVNAGNLTVTGGISKTSGGSSTMAWTTDGGVASIGGSSPFTGTSSITTTTAGAQLTIAAAVNANSLTITSAAGAPGLNITGNPGSTADMVQITTIAGRALQAVSGGAYQTAYFANNTASATTVAVVNSQAAAGALALAVTGGVTMSNNLTVTGSVSSANFSSGGYAGTITNITNISSTSSDAVWLFTRNGNIVTVDGTVSIIATTTGTTAINIAIPFPSNFTLSNDVKGSGVATDSFVVSTVTADTSADKVRLTFTALAGGVSNNFPVHFTYTIQ